MILKSCQRRNQNQFIGSLTQHWSSLVNSVSKLSFKTMCSLLENAREVNKLNKQTNKRDLETKMNLVT